MDNMAKVGFAIRADVGSSLRRIDWNQLKLQ